MKYREVTKIVEADGWYVVRQAGSHKQYHHPKKKGTLTIAGHPNDDVPPKTLRRIYQQAQIEQV